MVNILAAYWLRFQRNCSRVVAKLGFGSGAGLERKPNRVLALDFKGIGKIQLPNYNCQYTCSALRGASMAQVTIYLDDAAEKRVKQAARKAGVSVSRWIAGLVENRTRTDWPAEARELAGAWPDFPDLEEIRHLAAKDTARARL